MKSEDKKATSDTVTMRKLAPTVRYEEVLLAEMAGTIAAFAEVPADVLILGGSKGLPFLKSRPTPLPTPSRTTSAWSSPASITAAQATPAAPTPAAASQNSSPRRCAASSHSRDPQAADRAITPPAPCGCGAW